MNADTTGRAELDRATEAGLLAAAAAVPLTFQRSLTSRSTLDQAIVTGLSFTLFQSAVSTVEAAPASTLHSSVENSCSVASCQV